jgi:hypothetical protein
MRHGHGLGRGGGFVEQRGVGDVEPGEVRDQRLEIEQRLEPALADLRLIGRIGGIPGGVLQDVALDRTRFLSAVSRIRSIAPRSDSARPKSSGVFWRISVGTVSSIS